MHVGGREEEVVKGSRERERGGGFSVYINRVKLVHVVNGPPIGKYQPLGKMFPSLWREAAVEGPASL